MYMILQPIDQSISIPYGSRYFLRRGLTPKILPQKVLGSIAIFRVNNILVPTVWRRHIDSIARWVSKPTNKTEGLFL
jgi:hypothetical protein